MAVSYLGTALFQGLGQNAVCAWGTALSRLILANWKVTATKEQQVQLLPWQKGAANSSERPAEFTIVSWTGAHKALILRTEWKAIIKAFNLSLKC